MVPRGNNSDPSRLSSADRARNTEIDIRLSRTGQRWTKARRLVVDTVKNANAPMAVPEIQTAVGPDVPLSTLYRILNDLITAKVLTKLEFAEGFARYELDEGLVEHHHHLVCTTCAKVVDLELDDLEEVLGSSARTIKRRNGFTVTTHRLDFFGVCAACT